MTSLNFLGIVVLNLWFVSEVRGGACNRPDESDVVNICYGGVILGSRLYLETNLTETNMVSSCSCSATIQFSGGASTRQMNIFPLRSWRYCHYKMDVKYSGIKGSYHCAAASSNQPTSFFNMANGNSATIDLSVDTGQGSRALSECFRIEVPQGTQDTQIELSCADKFSNIATPTQPPVTTQLPTQTTTHPTSQLVLTTTPTPQLPVTTQPETTQSQSIITTQPPVTTQGPVTTQPPATTQLPETTQPPGTTQLSLTTPLPTQPRGTTQTPLTTQPPATTQSPTTTQPPATTQAPVTTQPTGATQVTWTTQPPATTQLSATTKPNSITQTQVTTQPPATSQSPMKTQPPDTNMHTTQDHSRIKGKVTRKSYSDLTVGIGVGAGTFLLLVALIGIILCQRKNNQQGNSNLPNEEVPIKRDYNELDNNGFVGKFDESSNTEHPYTVINEIYNPGPPDEVAENDIIPQTTESKENVSNNLEIQEENPGEVPEEFPKYDNSVNLTSPNEFVDNGQSNEDVPETKSDAITNTTMPIASQCESLTKTNDCDRLENNDTELCNSHQDTISNDKQDFSSETPTSEDIPVSIPPPPSMDK